MFPFCPPTQEKHPKTIGVLLLTGGIGRVHWEERIKNFSLYYVMYAFSIFVILI